MWNSRDPCIHLSNYSPSSGRPSHHPQTTQSGFYTSKSEYSDGQHRSSENEFIDLKNSGLARSGVSGMSGVPKHKSSVVCPTRAIRRGPARSFIADDEDDPYQNFVPPTELYLSEDLMDFLRTTLIKKPRNRVKAVDALKHKWMYEDDLQEYEEEGYFQGTEGIDEEDTVDMEEATDAESTFEENGSRRPSRLLKLVPGASIFNRSAESNTTTPHGVTPRSHVAIHAGAVSGVTPTTPSHNRRPSYLASPELGENNEQNQKESNINVTVNSSPAGGEAEQLGRSDKRKGSLSKKIAQFWGGKEEERDDVPAGTQNDIPRKDSPGPEDSPQLKGQSSITSKGSPRPRGRSVDSQAKLQQNISATSSNANPGVPSSNLSKLKVTGKLFVKRWGWGHNKEGKDQKDNKGEFRDAIGQPNHGESIGSSPKGHDLGEPMVTTPTAEGAHPRGHKLASKGSPKGTAAQKTPRTKEEVLKLKQQHNKNLGNPVPASDAELVAMSVESIKEAIERLQRVSDHLSGQYDRSAGEAILKPPSFREPSEDDYVSDISASVDTHEAGETGSTDHKMTQKLVMLQQLTHRVPGTLAAMQHEQPHQGRQKQQQQQQQQHQHQQQQQNQDGGAQ